MGLTFIAVVLLAAAWAAILLPDLRNRGSAPRRSNSVKSFRQHLSGLDRTRPGAGYGAAPNGGARPLANRAGTSARPLHGPATGATGHSTPSSARPGGPSARPRPRTATAPRSSMLPRNRAEAAQRRLVTLAALVGLALVTLLAGLVAARALLLVHLLVDAALGAYVYLLWERSARARTRRSSLVTLGDTSVADGSATVTHLRREATGS